MAATHHDEPHHSDFNHFPAAHNYQLGLPLANHNSLGLDPSIADSVAVPNTLNQMPGQVPNNIVTPGPLAGQTGLGLPDSRALPGQAMGGQQIATGYMNMANNAVYGSSTQNGYAATQPLQQPLNPFAPLNQYTNQMGGNAMLTNVNSGMNAATLNNALMQGGDGRQNNEKNQLVGIDPTLHTIAAKNAVEEHGLAKSDQTLPSNDNEFMTVDHTQLPVNHDTTIASEANDDLKIHASTEHSMVSPEVHHFVVDSNGNELHEMNHLPLQLYSQGHQVTDAGDHATLEADHGLIDPSLSDEHSESHVMDNIGESTHEPIDSTEEHIMPSTGAIHVTEDSHGHVHKEASHSGYLNELGKDGAHEVHTAGGQNGHPYAIHVSDDGHGYAVQSEAYHDHGDSHSTVEHVMETDLNHLDHADHIMGDHEIADHGSDYHLITDHGGLDHEIGDHGVTVHESDHAIVDVGHSDHGVIDHGLIDHGSIDHGIVDHGIIDHGIIDHGGLDHGIIDHGGLDHGIIDHGSLDHGIIDHGSLDHGIIDNGGLDHGIMDHGGLDHGIIDHGIADHGGLDPGMIDHGGLDHGIIDHGIADPGMIDHGSLDHGIIDHGSLDHGIIDHGMIGHDIGSHGIGDGGFIDHGSTEHVGMAEHETHDPGIHVNFHAMEHGNEIHNGMGALEGQYHGALHSEYFPHVLDHGHHDVRISDEESFVGHHEAPHIVHPYLHADAHMEVHHPHVELNHDDHRNYHDGGLAPELIQTNIHSNTVPEYHGSNPTTDLHDINEAAGHDVRHGINDVAGHEGMHETMAHENEFPVPGPALDHANYGGVPPQIQASSLEHGDAMHGDAMHGDVMHGDAMHGDAMHGDAMHGDAMHGDVMHGDAMHGDAMHGDAMHGDAMHGGVMNNAPSELGVHGFDEHGAEFLINKGSPNHEEGEGHDILQTQKDDITDHSDENQVHLDEKDAELLKKAKDNELVDPPYLTHLDPHGDGFGEGVVGGPDLNVGNDFHAGAPVSDSFPATIPNGPPFVGNHPATSVHNGNIVPDYGTKRHRFENSPNSHVKSGYVSVGEPKKPDGAGSKVAEKLTSSGKTDSIKPKLAKFMEEKTGDELALFASDRLDKEEQTFETIPNEPRIAFKTVPNEENKKESPKESSKITTNGVDKGKEHNTTNGAPSNVSNEGGEAGNETKTEGDETAQQEATKESESPKEAESVKDSSGKDGDGNKEVTDSNGKKNEKSEAWTKEEQVNDKTEATATEKNTTNAGEAQSNSENANKTENGKDNEEFTVEKGQQVGDFKSGNVNAKDDSEGNMKNDTNQEDKTKANDSVNKQAKSLSKQANAENGKAGEKGEEEDMKDKVSKQKEGKEENELENGTKNEAEKTKDTDTKEVSKNENSKEAKEEKDSSEMGSKKSKSKENKSKNSKENQENETSETREASIGSDEGSGEGETIANKENEQKNEKKETGSKKEKEKLSRENNASENKEDDSERKVKDNKKNVGNETEQSNEISAKGDKIKGMEKDLDKSKAKGKKGGKKENAEDNNGDLGTAKQTGGDAESNPGGRSAKEEIKQRNPTKVLTGNQMNNDANQAAPAGNETEKLSGNRDVTASMGKFDNGEEGVAGSNGTGNVEYGNEHKNETAQGKANKNGNYGMNGGAGDVNSYAKEDGKGNGEIQKADEGGESIERKKGDEGDMMNGETKKADGGKGARDDDEATKESSTEKGYEKVGPQVDDVSNMENANEGKVAKNGKTSERKEDEENVSVDKEEWKTSGDGKEEKQSTESSASGPIAIQDTSNEMAKESGPTESPTQFYMSDMGDGSGLVKTPTESVSTQPDAVQVTTDKSNHELDGIAKSEAEYTQGDEEQKGVREAMTLDTGPGDPLELIETNMATVQKNNKNDDADTETTKESPEDSTFLRLDNRSKVGPRNAKKDKLSTKRNKRPRYGKRMLHKKKTNRREKGKLANILKRMRKRRNIAELERSLMNTAVNLSKRKRRPWYLKNSFK